MNIRTISSATLGSLPAFMAATACAHHFAATHYDPSNPRQITGVVAEFQLISPHTTIFVDVANDEGSVERWVVETSGANGWRRRGWDADTFKPGDVITVSGWPHRSGIPQLEGRQFLRADGTEPERLTSQDLIEAYPPDPAAMGFSGRWLPPRRGADGTSGSPLPLTPAGLESWQDYDPERSPVATCEMMNIPTLFYPGYLFDIRVNEREVILDHELYDLTRRIPLDSEPGPQHESGLLGVATARMQRDELVVESSGFPPSPWGLAVAVLRNGNGADVPSSARKRVTERYSVSGDGKTLRLDFTVEDPVYLTEPFSDYGEWTRVADDAPIVFDYNCDPVSAGRFTGSTSERD